MVEICLRRYEEADVLMQKLDYNKHKNNYQKFI